MVLPPHYHIPHLPKSNGFIERHVQTVNAALIKSQQAKTDPDPVVSVHNAYFIQPSKSHGNPDWQTAMSNISTKLTSPQPEDNIYQELRQRQLTRQKMYHDQHTKNIPHLACTLAGSSDWGVEGSNSPGEVRRAEIVPANDTRGTAAETEQGPHPWCPQACNHHRIAYQQPPARGRQQEPAPGPEQPSAEPAQQRSKQPNAPYTTRSSWPSKPPWVMDLW